jgi:hypothetical protein
MFKIRLFWCSIWANSPLESSKKNFDGGERFFGLLCVFTYCFGITTLLLWEARLSYGGHVCVRGFWSCVYWGCSVRVVAFDNVVVVFTAFIVSWVVPSAQGTFRRRVL